MVPKHKTAYEFASVFSLLLESIFPLSTVLFGKASEFSVIYRASDNIYNKRRNLHCFSNINNPQPADGRIVRDIVVAMPIRSSRETER
jgi:hypothetical protein